MNGFTAADMSTAAANGHAEGYQAGYADAVKAVETTSTQQPVAEIAWSDDGYKIGLLGPLRAHRLPIGTKLYAAPVAAAPVGMTRDDAEQAISRIMGEYGFSMPSRAYAELVDELMSTPAAPGIDVEELIAIRNQLHQMSAAKDIGEGWADVVNELMGDVQKLIDASPKGGSNAESRFAFCAEHETFPVRTQDGRHWIMFVATDPAHPNIRVAHPAATPAAAIDAAMQATSAEVGS